MIKFNRIAPAAISIFALLLAAPAFAGPGDHDKDDRGYLGVTLAHIQHKQHEGHNSGLFVVGLVDEGGAKAAGLKPHDKLLSIDGKSIEHMSDIDAALEKTRPGDRVSVTVLRNDDEQTYDVVLGERQHNVRVEMFESPHMIWIGKDGRATLGVRAEKLGKQLASFFGVDSGVLVSEVIEDGAAWKAGLRAGDVIVAFNGKPIEDMKELHKALGKTKPGDVADVEVDRRGRLETFAVTLEKGSDHESTVTIELKEGIHKHMEGMKNIFITTEEGDEEDE